MTFPHIKGFVSFNRVTFVHSNIMCLSTSPFQRRWCLGTIWLCFENYKIWFCSCINIVKRVLRLSTHLFQNAPYAHQSMVYRCKICINPLTTPSPHFQVVAPPEIGGSMHPCTNNLEHHFYTMPIRVFFAFTGHDYLPNFWAKINYIRLRIPRTSDMSDFGRFSLYLGFASLRAAICLPSDRGIQIRRIQLSRIGVGIKCLGSFEVREVPPPAPHFSRT